MQAVPDFSRSKIIQSLSNLISSIDYIVCPTNGNSVICGQAKKMLQAIVDTVLSPEHNQNDVGHAEPAAGLDALMEEALNDQMWLENIVDMDFWISLEDHPLLAWPEVMEHQ